MKNILPRLISTTPARVTAGINFIFSLFPTLCGEVIIVRKTFPEVSGTLHLQYSHSTKYYDRAS
ncbi:MAG: hypothetical protein KGZ58_04995 [Ignavibacteriales bacterium]|nr:hypothetical protein [Ignavibacteriales bacterium]